MLRQILQARTTRAIQAMHLRLVGSFTSEIFDLTRMRRNSTQGNASASCAVFEGDPMPAAHA